MLKRGERFINIFTNSIIFRVYHKKPNHKRPNNKNNISKLSSSSDSSIDFARSSSKYSFRIFLRTQAIFFRTCLHFFLRISSRTGVQLRKSSENSSRNSLRFFQGNFQGHFKALLDKSLNKSWTLCHYNKSSSNLW